MLAIRLLRTGKKNQPTFKLVVTDKDNPPRGGRFVEEIGFYNPKTKERNLKKERAQYWISQGAKPSDTVYNMLVSEKIIEGKKKPSHKASKKEQAPAEAPKEEKPSTEENLPQKKEEAPAAEQPAQSPEAEKKEEAAPEEGSKEKPAEAPVQEQPPKEEPQETQKEEPKKEEEQK